MRRPVLLALLLLVSLLLLSGCQPTPPPSTDITPAPGGTVPAPGGTVPPAGITSTEEIGSAGETAVDILLAALERQQEAAAIVTNPELGRDVAAIRGAVLQASPHIVFVSAQIGFAQALTGDEMQPLLSAALADEGSIVQLAPLILLPTTPDDQVLLHFDELVIHGGAALGAINLALSLLGAGPSAPGAGHVLVEGELQAPSGYQVEIVANNLNFATVVEVAEDGTVYVAEAGYSYGNIQTPARVLRVGEDGATEVVAEGFNGPIAGLATHESFLFVSHRNMITRIDLESGERLDIVTGLPSNGDHFNENIAVGPDGKLYITQGVATNSGVVGLDNYLFGWLPVAPDVHDIPCRDLTLAGENYTTGNILTPDVTDVVSTGAYLPYGTPGEPGQAVTGEVKCSGAVLRANLDGSELEVFADGFRNPYGLAFAPDGRLFVTENGPDVRGSRPLTGPDNFYEVIQGGWYGWPDFYGGVQVGDPSLTPPGHDPLKPVLLDPPPLAAQPVAKFTDHAVANGFDFSTAEDFAPVGQAFVSLFGDLTPPTAGGVVVQVGQEVVTVSPDGEIESFLTSAAGDNGSPFFRPTDATFSPDGMVLYVTHFGQIRGVPGGIVPTPGTGALLRLTR